MSGARFAGLAAVQRGDGSRTGRRASASTSTSARGIQRGLEAAQASPAQTARRGTATKGDGSSAPALAQARLVAAASSASCSVGARTGEAPRRACSATRAKRRAQASVTIAAIGELTTGTAVRSTTKARGAKATTASRQRRSGVASGAPRRRPTDPTARRR
jgi:hypothetical protein